jgi:hypothetical protein
MSFVLYEGCTMLGDFKIDLEAVYILACDLFSWSKTFVQLTFYNEPCWSSKSIYVVVASVFMEFCCEWLRLQSCCC